MFGKLFMSPAEKIDLFCLDHFRRAAEAFLQNDFQLAKEISEKVLFTLPNAVHNDGYTRYKFVDSVDDLEFRHYIPCYELFLLFYGYGAYSKLDIKGYLCALEKIESPFSKNRFTTKSGGVEPICHRNSRFRYLLVPSFNISLVKVHAHGLILSLWYLSEKRKFFGHLDEAEIPCQHQFHHCISGSQFGQEGTKDLSFNWDDETVSYEFYKICFDSKSTLGTLKTCINWLLSITNKSIVYPSLDTYHSGVWKYMKKHKIPLK